MSAYSLREVQQKLYGGKEGPPILPHGDDLEVIQERRRAKKRRKLSVKRTPTNAKMPPTFSSFRMPGVAVAPPPYAAAAAPFGAQTLAPGNAASAAAAAPKEEPNAWMDPLEREKLNAMFPASELPAGFPPELAFRALAAYATIRTLSLKLRLSPFTPIVFLRALYLPLPTRLLGHVHVALLRLLLPHLGQHYHWGAAVPHHGTAASQLKRFPWLHQTKKRKLDGLRWPLRAGDDLENMDPFTWPPFLDDYAHLTADQLYWCATGPPYDELNRNVDDPKENPNVWNNLDVSTVPDDWEDPTEDWRERRNPKVPSMSVLYLKDPGAVDDDSDVEEDAFVTRDEDEEFDLAAAVAEEEEEAPRKKRKRGRPRKFDPQGAATKTADAAKKPVASAPNTASSDTNPSAPRVPLQMQIQSVSFATPGSTMNFATPNSSGVGSMPNGAAAMMGMNYPPAAFANKQQQALALSMMNGQHVSPAVLFLQQQMQAQQNSSMMAAAMASVRPRSVPTSSSRIQNRMSQRALPTAAMPAAARSSHGYVTQPSKKMDPKLAAAADTLEQYMYGSDSNHYTPQMQADASDATIDTGDGKPVASSNSDPPANRSDGEDVKLPTKDMSVENVDGERFGCGPSGNDGQPESKVPAKEDSAEPGTDKPAAVVADKAQGDKTSTEKGESSEGMADTQMNDAEEEDEQSAAAPFVWAHFEAIKEMRSGKAYHELSVERKLDILEYLIDEVLTLEMVADEMSFRCNSKERYDHPYGDLPKPEELEDLENDDNCAVCLGDGDLLCCDGCPSSYHQQCIGLPANEELPEGKWYCPECVLVDPAKFGPLREGPKSSLDWFHLRDVCRSQKHLLSLNQRKPTPAMHEENEYMVVHGFVFRRPRSVKLPVDPAEGPNTPLVLSKVDLRSFFDKVGPEDCQRWPLSQIPTKDASSVYLREKSTYDPNCLSNKYRMVAPLFVPKKLSCDLLKTVEEECARLQTYHVSDLLSSNVGSDARLIELLRSPKSPFSEAEIAVQYARDLQQKLLRALLFRANYYFWATESFLPLLPQARTIKSASRALVQLIDAVHPRAFEEEWFESPSHSNKNLLTVDWRKMSSNVRLCEDSSPASETLRRTWQCMQPGNVPCSLSKKLVQPQEWIREVRPDLAHSSSPHKSKRKRDNQHVKQPTSFRGMVHFNSEKKLDPTKDNKPVEEDPVDSGEDEEGYHFRRSRHEKNSEPTEKRNEKVANVQKQVENEQEKLVSFILGVPPELWIQEPNWPVAGRRLFEPTGELPRKDVRRLARRAGSVRAPFVMYSQSYEVGQASCYHIWRKKMLACTSFENLLLGMRTIAAFLDTDAIRQGTTAARKYAKKPAVKCDVYCSCTDMSSGEESYLVLDRNGSTGSWVPAHSVDIKMLISYQSKRIKELEAKKRAELLKQSARRVHHKPQAPPAPTQSQSANHSGIVGGLPTKVTDIIQGHNQNILRLFWAHPNSMGAEFLQARMKIRAETAATLLKTLGVSFDPLKANTFLAGSEKAFLESIKPKFPALLRNVKDLYPENLTESFLPSEMSGAPTENPARAAKRRDYRCGNCGKTGHNSKKCPTGLSSTRQEGLAVPPVMANSSGSVLSNQIPNSYVSQGAQPPFGKKQGKVASAPPASSRVNNQSSSFRGPGMNQGNTSNNMGVKAFPSPPANIDPEVWRQYLVSQGFASNTAPLSAPKPHSSPNTSSSWQTMHPNALSKSGGGNLPNQMQMNTASGMSSMGFSVPQQFQQRGPTGAMQGSPFHGQDAHSLPNSGQSFNQQQQQRVMQNPNPFQMNGASSHFTGANAFGNQQQSFSMAGQNNVSSNTQPGNNGTFQNHYQGGFSPNRGGVGNNATNQSQMLNNLAPNANMNIYASILGLNKQSRSAHSTHRTSNTSIPQIPGSGSRPNHSQQNSRPLPRMIGQEEMEKYAAQFPGLEPTPIRNMQQGNGGKMGTPSIGQSPQNSNNDPNQMLDFFSPTPIHPNHQLNRANLQHSQQQQQPQQSPVGMNPHQHSTFPPPGANGFNPKMGQFSQQQR